MRGEEWWDKKCEMREEEVRRELRRWRRVGEERYRTAKREYKELCDRKKREENKRWERRVVEARREEVWEL